MPSVQPKDLARWHVDNYRRQKSRNPITGVYRDRPFWLRAEIWIPILVIVVTIFELWTHR